MGRYVITLPGRRGQLFVCAWKLASDKPRELGWSV